MWRTGAALAIALSALLPVTASALDDGGAAVGSGGVGSADPRVEALIAQGAARSVTLRTVIARLGRTPYPLVRLDAGYHQTADLKISIIAHELQHALETAAALRLEKQVMRELRRQPPLTAAPRHAATASDRPQPTH